MADDDTDTSSRPISVAELLARAGNDGEQATPTSGGRRRRGGQDSRSVAEVTGEIPRIGAAGHTGHTFHDIPPHGESDQVHSEPDRHPTFVPDDAAQGRSYSSSGPRAESQTVDDGRTDTVSAVVDDPHALATRRWDASVHQPQAVGESGASTDLAEDYTRPLPLQRPGNWEESTDERESGGIDRTLLSSESGGLAGGEPAVDHSTIEEREQAFAAYRNFDDIDESTTQPRRKRGLFKRFRSTPDEPVPAANSALDSADPVSVAQPYGQVATPGYPVSDYRAPEYLGSDHGDGSAVEDETTIISDAPLSGAAATEAIVDLDDAHDSADAAWTSDIADGPYSADTTRIDPGYLDADRLADREQVTAPDAGYGLVDDDQSVPASYPVTGQPLTAGPSIGGPSFDSPSIDGNVESAETTHAGGFDQAVDDEEREHEAGTVQRRSSPTRQWLALGLQIVVGLAVGVGLFYGFTELWKWNVYFALVLAVVVVFALVTLAHVARRSSDLLTTLLALGVGLIVTIGPLAFLAAGS